MNHSNITLGELLSHQNETIKRNAMSILKTLQKEKEEYHHDIGNQYNGIKCKNCPIHYK